MTAEQQALEVIDTAAEGSRLRDDAIALLAEFMAQTQAVVASNSTRKVRLARIVRLRLTLARDLDSLRPEERPPI